MNEPLFVATALIGTSVFRVDWLTEEELAAWVGRLAVKAAEEELAAWVGRLAVKAADVDLTKPHHELVVKVWRVEA